MGNDENNEDVNLCVSFAFKCSYETHFECHDTLMLGKRPIKWRQLPDMTTAVEWDVKQQSKQTNQIRILLSEFDLKYICAYFYLTML